MAATARATAAWRIIPRPLLETILNNYAHHHRVPQPLLLHGPRGIGKTSLLLHRLLPQWNKPPHVVGYVDFAAAASDDHPIPWAALPSPPPLATLRIRLHRELESMVDRAVRLGIIGSRDVFRALNSLHGLHTALRRLIGPARLTKKDENAPLSALWAKAVLALIDPGEVLDSSISTSPVKSNYSREELAYMRETLASLRLAREVIQMHQSWRREAVRHLNRTGGFSRSLANSATDWPCLLLDLLSEAAEVDSFQPKLVLNNIDVLRKAIEMDDSTVPAAMYHDSFIWRLISLGVNKKCLPAFLVTSDSYYSYRAFIDFGFKDIFISRETFGWTNQEARLHMVSEFFSESEWKVIEDVLGPNQRHLSELYELKQSTYYKEVMQDARASFEDIVDAYLAYLQVAVVNPAMETVLTILQKFVSDAHDGKIPEGRLQFGAPWRHPPRTNDSTVSLRWAKIQLLDFVQSFVNTEFGAGTPTAVFHMKRHTTFINRPGRQVQDLSVNYLADCSLEILDDPSAVAMLEVGLLYAQRDPSFIRPISRGIQRCLARWLVQERMQMSHRDYILYLWQRIIRGRSYRHLMKEIGYK